MKNLWCQYDLAPIGERKEPCNKPTEKGAQMCRAHAALYPFWPLNDDGTPCTPSMAVR